MLYAASMVAAKVVKKAWYVCKARNDIGIAMNIPFLGKKNIVTHPWKILRKSLRTFKINRNPMNNFQGLSKSHGKNVTYDRISKTSIYSRYCILYWEGGWVLRKAELSRLGWAYMTNHHPFFAPLLPPKGCCENQEDCCFIDDNEDVADIPRLGE